MNRKSPNGPKEFRPLFWIPMQWAGVALAVLGLVLALLLFTS